MTTGLRAFAFADDFFEHDGFFWGPVSGVLIMTRKARDGAELHAKYLKRSFTLSRFALPVWVPEFFEPDAPELALWFIGHALKRDVALAMVPERA